MTFTTTSLQKQIQKPFDPSTSFPYMLHQCLTDIEALEQRDPSMRKLSSIIGWQCQGTVFKVHDKKKFEELILPVWFIRLKYTSFIRQMNMFGFKKIQKDEASSGLQKGAMYHELFLQGQPELAKGIQSRKKHPLPCPLHQDTHNNSYYSGGMGVMNETKSIGGRGNMILQDSISPRYQTGTCGYVNGSANANANANGLVNLLSPTRTSTLDSNRLAATMKFPHSIIEEEHREQMLAATMKFPHSEEHREQMLEIDVSDLFRPSQQQQNLVPLNVDLDFLDTESEQWGDTSASLLGLLEPTPLPPVGITRAVSGSQGESSLLQNNRFVDSQGADFPSTMLLQSCNHPFASTVAMDDPFPFFNPVLGL